MSELIDRTFWERLESFVKDVQVNDMMGDEEKGYILLTAKRNIDAEAKVVQPIKDNVKLYYVWDGINGYLEEFETIEGCEEFIEENFKDSNEGIHPDIEMVFILKRIINTEVKENNGYHKIVFEKC